jgi:uncharacterized protein YjbJ (UPF0337 family)
MQGSPDLSPKERTMNVELLEGKWHVLKGKVRERWGRLTDDDVERTEGQAEILLGKLEELYGLDREAAKKELEVWLTAQPEVEDAERDQPRRKRL